MAKIKVGLIGYGYWGPNLLRNLVSNAECDVIGVVEPNAGARAKVSKVYPHIPVHAELKDLLSSRPDAVVIATPPATHRDIAVASMKSGAHILVEKPIAMSVAETDEILNLANQKNLKVMVDHTFCFNPAVEYLSSQIHSGSLGKLLYYDSVRVNLGGFQARTNVLWDLAPHDLAIIDMITGGKTPVAVSAVGMKHFDASVENLCYLNITYNDQFVAHLNANWVAPVKIRTVMIGGTSKMIVYDENLPTEKVKLYDKSLSVQIGEGRDPRASYRSGDMTAPAISNQEALGTMVAKFVGMILRGESSVADGHSGRRVVQILEAASQSMAQGGRPIEIHGLVDYNGRRIRVA